MNRQGLIRMLSLVHCKYSTNNSRALKAIIERNYTADVKDPLTAMIFVSVDDASTVFAAEASAALLRARGIRLALVGVGNLSMSAFAPIVGEHGVLEHWVAHTSLEPPEGFYDSLKRFMNCPPRKLLCCLFASTLGFTL